MNGKGASGAQRLLRPEARRLLSAHVLLLVLLLFVVRLAASHSLLFLLLGRGWFAGERYRCTDPECEECRESNEACVASHGNLHMISELMKPSHRTMRCCRSRKHSMLLMRVAKLFSHRVEQGRCLVS